MALTLKTGKLSEGMALCTRCEFPPVGAKSGLCPVCTKKLGAAEAARPVGKRSAAGRGASVSNIPVGNHGDNLQSDHHGQLSLFLEDAAEEAFNIRVSHERTAEAAYQREAWIVSLYAKHAGLSVEDVYDIFEARGRAESAE